MVQDIMQTATKIRDSNPMKCLVFGVVTHESDTTARPEVSGTIQFRRAPCARALLNLFILKHLCGMLTSLQKCREGSPACESGSPKLSPRSDSLSLGYGEICAGGDS